MPAKKPTAILLGSKPGAVVALSILLERGWNIKYVVVSKSIHHPWIAGPTIADLAREKGIKVIEQSEIPGDETGYRDWETDRKSTRLNSSHSAKSRMPSSA